MINDAQSITRGPLGRQEAKFLADLGGSPTFTIQDARKALKRAPEDPTSAFLKRLERKGWIRQIKRGHFAIIPLSSGKDRVPQLHEFSVAMTLVEPAAIAYWSALNHHGMTEQIPRTVFIATDHPVRRPVTKALGMTFKIVSVRSPKFFGMVKEWIDEQPFTITDREKTIIDGLDLPEYVGGIGELAKALTTSWKSLNESKLFQYAVKIGNATVVKRLGFLMETLTIGHPDELRGMGKLSSGFSPLDPTLPGCGKYNRRWGLLVNAGIQP